MFANILDGIMSALSLSALLANLMGVALGIVFGLYPAVKASGLQPVEALRAD